MKGENPEEEKENEKEVEKELRTGINQTRKKSEKDKVKKPGKWEKRKRVKKNFKKGGHKLEIFHSRFKSLQTEAVKKKIEFPRPKFHSKKKKILIFKKLWAAGEGY